MQPSPRYTHDLRGLRIVLRLIPTVASHSTIEITFFERSTRLGGGRPRRHGRAARVPLPQGRVIVGSSSRADVVVDDPTVSALHCALDVHPTGIGVEDLDSKNGTFVGGARVREAAAGVGTSIVLGHSTVTLCACAEGEEEEESEEEQAAPLPGIAGASRAMRVLAARVRRFAEARASGASSRRRAAPGKERLWPARFTSKARARCRRSCRLNVYAALPREAGGKQELFWPRSAGRSLGCRCARREGAFTRRPRGDPLPRRDRRSPAGRAAEASSARSMAYMRCGAVEAPTGAGKKPGARIVAATNATLGERVQAEAFRLDLFHPAERLCHRPAALSRARRGDIGPIAREILRHAPRRLEAAVSSRRARSPGSLRHDWPGNVRELRGVLYRVRSTRAPPSGALDALDVDRAIQGDRSASWPCPDRLRASASALRRAWIQPQRGGARSGDAPHLIPEAAQTLSARSGTRKPGAEAEAPAGWTSVCSCSSDGSAGRVWS